MKTISKYLIVPLIAVASCLTLAVSVARADDDEQGGDIEGTEQLDVELQMTPTAAAPAGSSINLELQASDDDGQTETELELDEQGLPAGTYTVSATLKSTGATVQIGTFTIASGQTDAEIQFSTDDQGENDNSDDGDEIELPFPTSVNPFDIATISVSDANGVVLFTADLTNVTSISATISASIAGQSGPTDPGATGSAVLNATASHNKPTGSLQITGQGLPNSTALKVMVNGLSSNVKKASTSSTGNVALTLIPKVKSGAIASGVNLLQIKSAVLTDKNGNVLLKFSF